MSTVRTDPAAIGPEYDVVISYAGENRQEAGQIAEALKSRSVRVFYDQFEQGKLWGANLYEYLADIYSHKAKFCIMLISAQYASKAWTSHERRFAQERAFRENQPYILPVRLDDTAIPGLLDTIGYVDWRSTTVEKLVELVLEKLGLSTTLATFPPGTQQADDCRATLMFGRDRNLKHNDKELALVLEEVFLDRNRGANPAFRLRFPSRDELTKEISAAVKDISSREIRILVEKQEADLSSYEEDIRRCLQLALHQSLIASHLYSAEIAVSFVRGLIAWRTTGSYSGDFTKIDIHLNYKSAGSFYINAQECGLLLSSLGLSDKQALLVGWPLWDLPSVLFHRYALPALIWHDLWRKEAASDEVRAGRIMNTPWLIGLG